MRSFKLLILFLLASAGFVLPSHLTAAHDISSDSGFMNCLSETRSLVLSNAAIAKYLQDVEGLKLEAPVQADMPGSRFSFEQLSPSLSDRLKTLLVSACLELHPSARKDINGPDFQVYLDGLLMADHSATEDQRVHGELEMLTLNALLNLDTDMGETLGPVLFTDIRNLLDGKVDTLPLDPDERQDLKMVLSYPLGPLQFVSPHPFMKFSAAVFGEHDLSIQLHNFRSDEFISMIVHESCHLNSIAASLRKKALKDLSKLDWVYLTLREEFRARYVTMRFEKAWYGYTHSFSSVDPRNYPGGEAPMNALFDDFVKSLRYVNSQQEHAVTSYLRFYNSIGGDEQNALLKSWVTTWD